jgi:hypothetical protein
MKEVTAVQWLINKLVTENEVALKGENYKLFELAKEIERGQIIKAVYHNCNAMSHSDLDCGEEYYSNQFKSE